MHCTHHTLHTIHHSPYTIHCTLHTTHTIHCTHTISYTTHYTTPYHTLNGYLTDTTHHFFHSSFLCLVHFFRILNGHLNGHLNGQIHAEGGRYLGRGLRHNESLVDLNLRLNRLTDEGTLRIVRIQSYTAHCTHTVIHCALYACSHTLRIVRIQSYTAHCTHTAIHCALYAYSHTLRIVRIQPYTAHCTHTVIHCALYTYSHTLHAILKPLVLSPSLRSTRIAPIRITLSKAVGCSSMACERTTRSHGSTSRVTHWAASRALHSALC
jgi:hypothetical protein